MKVSKIMTADPVTVPLDASLDDAVASMDLHGVRHLPVLDGDRFAGVISDRDLLEATGWLPPSLRDAKEGPVRARRRRTVREVLHTPAMSADPEDDVMTLLVESVVQGIGCMPVVRDGALLGIVTEYDLLEAYLEACDEGRIEGELDPPVQRVMTREVRTIEWNASLREAMRRCADIGAHHLPVVQAGNLIGLVSDRDLRRARGVGRPDDYPVEELMSTEVATAKPGDSLSAVARRMREQRFSSLPVVDGEAIVGIVTLTDVLDHAMNTLRDPDEGQRGGSH